MADIVGDVNEERRSVGRARRSSEEGAACRNTIHGFAHPRQAGGGRAELLLVTDEPERSGRMELPTPPTLRKAHARQPAND